jgi:glucose/arabinose dehydrogenase
VPRSVSRVVPLALLVLVCPACFRFRQSAGGGDEARSHRPPVVPADVALPAGYRLEVMAQGLTFPTGVTFDDQGKVYVVESGYSYGERFTTPRLLALEEGRVTPVVTGKNPPWTGVTFAQGAFFVSEGGVQEGGRILRIAPDGKQTVLVEGLPSLGDHHTNGPVVGPDGWIYFGQGTATNSGIVGQDNADFGWLKRHPQFHDVPCEEIALAGRNLESENPLTQAPDDKVTTGAYVPFGTATQAGQKIAGQVRCNGAVLKVAPTGGEPQVVAWGFRNPFGLAFSPEGRLYVTDNGFDIRGSRPVFGGADMLWEVKPGTWYGWPDHAEGRSVADRRYRPPGQPQPEPLLTRAPGVPPAPIAYLAVNSSSDGFDFSRSPDFGHVGQAFIAQFGDMTPGSGKVVSPVGFRVLRVDPTTGVQEDFAVNRTEGQGPASKVRNNGLERPVAARFDPSGNALYIVDFGVLTTDSGGPHPVEKTGVLWRITREEGR